MSIFPQALLQQAENLLQQLRAQNLTLATAESCTGGLVSALLTEIPGSSSVLTHGFVTYADAAKTSMIAVPQKLIDTHGAVSKEVAIAMAEGAQKTSGASIAVAITGIAGPTGGSEAKPVGLVHIACARQSHATLHHEYRFTGDRSEVRLQAATAALELVQKQLG